MPRSLRSAAALLALVLVTGAGLAACSSDDGSAGATGSLRIVDATVDRPITGETAAVRLVVDNGSSDADTLEAVSTPVARTVSIHRSVTDDRGLSTMEPVDDGLPVAARSKVTFEPGGLHVMLEDLSEPLEAGTTIDLRLTFQRSGVRTTSVEVVPTGTGSDENDTYFHDMEH